MATATETETADRLDLESWVEERVPCWMEDGNDAEWRMTLACSRRATVLICTECHDSVVAGETGVVDGCVDHIHMWSDTPRKIEFHSL